MDKMFNYFQPEKITAKIITEIPTKTIEVLYKEANLNIASLHNACIRIIDRCFKLQSWLFSFITALIGAMAFLLLSGNHNILMVILTAYGLIVFISISLFLFYKTMLNVGTYDAGIEPSTIIRKDMREYLDSNVKKEKNHKFILGSYLAIQQNMIAHNREVCIRLVGAYRIAVKAFLLSVGFFMLLLLLLILFL